MIEERETQSAASSNKYSFRSRDSDHRYISEGHNFSLNEADCSIDGLLANPIKSGYLLSYCKSQYSAENMIYLLDIDRFKDVLEDRRAWNEDLSYRVIDQTTEKFSMRKTEDSKFNLMIGGKHNWPSEKIPYIQYEQEVRNIWEKYLCSNSSSQIFIPSSVLSNTIHRIENLNLYGPTVFDETTLDPIKTLRSDVLPRFLASSHMAKIQSRLKEMYPLPEPADLTLKLPGCAMTLDWPNEKLTVENLRELTIDELFHERIVYLEFSGYSKKIFADENVLFARGLSIYRCCWRHATCKGCPPDAEDMAWKLFRFFICPGSPFQCSISRRRLKELMQGLAEPNVDMFKMVEKSCHRVIRNIYSAYSFTKEFQNLPEIIRQKRQERMREVQLQSTNTQSRSLCQPWKAFNM